ncbi:Glu-tRNA(Gln) amidotransferase GatDE subunit E [Candidatus Woesearchaeota archaeon CG10_big_fil_rev_8_21_14_0_10_34_12]|nr:MAG: Glu-tRNA(Gln) amidotransferase GatDE subunit E [Candidatus Woesearchaeota archaeon CG10_big_fil_rev_8_21_14_0_10_34_12]
MAEEIILKCGLEIHQQLDTNKLFCSCPSVLTDKTDYVVERKIVAVAGETGEVDIAAKHEAAKERDFAYQVDKDSCCLVELDEEPPHLTNQESLKIAIQIALFLNCEILPITQIMRKTVIDGSNTSGFQRSVLIARNGFLETESGKVRISAVMLEEDAARIISKTEKKTTYRLDRLGIPLIEIATSPDINNPKQAKEAALHLGEILRACKVKRGIGTIRQDVNMSIKLKEKSKIKQGERIEIKGVQEPALIEKTILTEIERQKKLIKENKSKSEVRKALPTGHTEFLRPMPGSSRMYPETDLPLLKISRELMNEVKKSLPKLKSEIRGELRERGLGEEMIKLLLSENKLDEFEALIKLYNKPDFIVKSLVLWPKEIASKEKLDEKQKEKRLSTDIIESIIHEVAKKKLREEDVKQILQELAKGKKLEEALKLEKKEIKLEEEIRKLIKEKPNLSINAYMGLMMQKHKGISGKDVMEILKKLL